MQAGTRHRHAHLRVLAVIAAFAAMVLLTACGSSSDDATSGGSTTAASTDGKELKPLRVAYIPAFGTLPIHIAAERGLFKKNGIDLQATEGSDITAWTPALGKQFDIALASPTIFLNAAAAGLPVQVVSGMNTAGLDNPNNVMISMEPIEQITDLLDKKVGVISVAGGAYDSVRYLLIKAGADPKKVRFIAAPLPTQADQVKAGQLDAAVSATPFFAGLDRRGFAVSDDVTVQAIREASGGRLDATATAFMISTKGFLEENPDLGNGYREAISEAMKWIDENPDEARRMLQSWLRLPAGVVDGAQIAGMSADESVEDLEAWIELATTTGTLRKAPPAVNELIWGPAVGPVTT